MCVPWSVPSGVTAGWQTPLAPRQRRSARSASRAVKKASCVKASASSSFVRPLSRPSFRCERSCSGRFMAISALTVTRLRSLRDSPGRAQTSPNSTSSVSCASLGATSPSSRCARVGSVGAVATSCFDAAYCASLTGSSQSTVFPSLASVTAMCVIALVVVCCTVPVLHARRDVNHVAHLDLLHRAAEDLNAADACGDDQGLPGDACATPCARQRRNAPSPSRCARASSALAGSRPRPCR